MGISRIVDGRIYSLKSNAEPCTKNSDCMFNNNGSCSAESCIFDELPPMQVYTRKISCLVCEESTTNISIYSGKTDYVCRDCKKKIHTTIKDPKCALCNTKIEPGEGICSSCANELKNSSCALCGTSTSMGKSLCTSCAGLIRGKLNEQPQS